MINGIYKPFAHHIIYKKRERTLRNGTVLFSPSFIGRVGLLPDCLCTHESKKSEMKADICVKKAPSDKGRFPR